MTDINELLKDYEECTINEWANTPDEQTAKLSLNKEERYYFKKKKPEIKFPVRVELDNGRYAVIYSYCVELFLHDSFELEFSELDKINKAVAEIKEQQK